MIEFQGTKYYETKRAGYFISSSRSGGETLQRAVWQETYGNIPHGWHVHHKDRAPKSTVNVDDLDCLPAHDHFREHQEQHLAQTGKRLRFREAFICVVCGDAYRAVRSGHGNKYCSRLCRVKAWRARK